MTTQILSNTPDAERDCWRTPLPVFNWLNARFQFDVDLAASDDNALCDRYVTVDTNSLTRPWHKLFRCGFLNPPYSDIEPWIVKAKEEMRLGFTTVMLLPSPNGERYHELAMDDADELILIHGRLAFTKPDGRPVPGNTRGSCVYVFSPHFAGFSECRLRYISRDWIFREFGSKAA